METMPAPDVRVTNSRLDLEHAAAEAIVRAAQRAVEERGVCHIGLAGGETPRSVYALLAGAGFRDRIAWERVHLFFCDERMVPPDDAQSNFRMAAEELISRVPVPASNVHRIHGELPPDEAAADYARELASIMPAPQPSFDLLLLGIGDDGHTASLFPGTPVVDDTADSVRAVFVPKFNAWRVTLTLALINRSREIVFLVSGAGKQAIVHRLLTLAAPTRDLPASLIRPGAGTLVWLLDKDAATVYG